jgi:hypothetical protein
MKRVNEALQKMVMKGTPLRPPLKEKVFSDMKGLIHAVTKPQQGKRDRPFLSFYAVHINCRDMDEKPPRTGKRVWQNLSS